MIEEERSPACNAGGRIEDHCVDITEMVGTMPEDVPPAESIKKLQSRKRKQPKALKRPPGETQITSNSDE